MKIDVNNGFGSEAAHIPSAGSHIVNGFNQEK